MSKSRREFLKTTALFGSVASGFGVGTIAKLAEAGERSILHDHGYEYRHNDPENIIYSTCLQCHTACPIKTKVVDGVVVKIDGNPYSPQNLIPHFDYDSSLNDAAKKEGKLCPKGQAGIETLYDNYRIRKVLKRAGPRGSDKWQTIPLDQAVEEIVNGGRLFEDIGEEREVEGLRDMFVLKDSELSKSMQADIKRVKDKKMTVSAFKEQYMDHLHILIDPDHPDFGPKNNQFVFLAGRIEHGRKELMKRFTYDAFGSVNAFEHTTICEQSHHIAYEQMTNQYKTGKWSGGKHHMKPDILNSEYVIFFGTGAFEANFGPTNMSEKITKSLVERNFKFAVVDPRLSKTASKAETWIPIKPGADGALALGMIRWIIENRRYDTRHLVNANKKAAHDDAEPTWTNATYLVKIKDGVPEKLLRANEIGIGNEHEFVVYYDGKFTAVNPDDDKEAIHGELFIEVTHEGMEIKSAFTLLRDSVLSLSIDTYGEICGLENKTITDLADEFTSHGKKAVVEFYRGPVQHTNGYYNAQALITLNLLVGNPDWKGGLSKGGGHWHEFGGKKGNVYDFKEMHPGKLKSFGIKISREKARYEDTTLFNGYPAKRPFYPFTSNLYQEVIPSAADGYPYPLKALFLHKGTPVLACPAGHKLIPILQDAKKIPLFIACDVAIAETSMYADYIIPDLTFLERWGTPHISPDVPTAVSKVRQPASKPVTEETIVDGEEMPICMESFLIAIAKRLGLSGFGGNGFGQGRDFNRPEDFYLKAIANIAMGDKENDNVPEVDEYGIELFRNARKHLPDSVFNEEKWRKATGDEYWKKVLYVLNRGGRFEDSNGAYDGDYMKHKFGKMFNIYIESVATSRNNMTGEYFNGIPIFEPIKDAGGNEIEDKDYGFKLITFKDILGGQSRTRPANYWLSELEDENRILVNKLDVQELGLRDGDVVKLVSKTNPTGTFDIGGGKRLSVKGKIKAIHGIRPGVVAVSWHFGHWAYGSNDVIIDGHIIKGDKRRGKGLVPNPVMREDETVNNVCLTDPIGGSASFYDTWVNILRV